VSEGPAIRPARPDDYERIIAVVDEWWGRPIADKLPRLFLDHFSSTSLIAEDAGGELAGLLIGLFSADRADEAYVHFIAVSPAERGGGLARALYERFFALAAADGRTRVRAITAPVNRGSIRFHQALGFALEEGDSSDDGIPYMREWDGPGAPRVRFVREL
jgi:ribosomal protein S18 acetylase RimI-like enzyme